MDKIVKDEIKQTLNLVNKLRIANLVVSILAFIFQIVIFSLLIAFLVQAISTLVDYYNDSLTGTTVSATSDTTFMSEFIAAINTKMVVATIFGVISSISSIAALITWIFMHVKINSIKTLIIADNQLRENYALMQSVKSVNFNLIGWYFIYIPIYFVAQIWALGMVIMYQINFPKFARTLKDAVGIEGVAKADLNTKNKSQSKAENTTQK